MAVLTYVVIGAIVNLCAGFVCGLLMVRNREAPCSTIATGRLGARARGLTQPTVPPGRSVATGSATPQAATQDETAGGGASHDSSSGPHAAGNAAKPATVSQTWSDFHQQLEQVQKRLGYARSVADKRLAVEVAGQLDACARLCYDQLHQCLDRESAHPGSLGIDRSEAAAIEMFLSQTRVNLDEHRLVGPRRTDRTVSGRVGSPGHAAAHLSRACRWSGEAARRSTRGPRWRVSHSQSNTLAKLFSAKARPSFRTYSWISAASRPAATRAAARRLCLGHNNPDPEVFP